MLIREKNRPTNSLVNISNFSKAQKKGDKVTENKNSHNFFVNEKIVPNVGYLVFRECSPEWKIKDRLGVFNYWDLTYLIKGAAQYKIDGKIYNLSAGDLLCLPPGHQREAHTYPDNLMHCFAANFSLNSFDSQEPAVIPLSLVSHIGLREDIIQLFNELIFQGGNQ